MRKPLLQQPTKGAQGGVIGRPRAEPPSDAAERIEALAADGFSVVGVASKLGVNPDVLKRWMDDDAALRDAFNAGREQERYALHNKLYRIAMESADVKAASIASMFLLKARHGYREGDQGEQGSRSNVTINLLGAMSREDFMKTVSVTKSD